MTYLHNQWENLIVYITDGQLRLSNILAENAIRPFAVGRRAWLFADTPAGADASAIHYSLIETAKTLEPYAYLNAVTKVLPYADTVEKSKSCYRGISKNHNLTGYLRTFNKRLRYSSHRLHSYLDYQSPNDFER